MITTLLTTISLWFHTMATIMLIGHYQLLALVYLPVFRQHFQGKALLDLLGEINGAARKRIYTALGMFAITGVYLTLANEAYLGVGNFGNVWSALMLAKHILIGLMIVLVVMFNNTVKAGATGSEADPKVPARLRLLLQGILVSGMLVILLTAFAQA
ncbi:MAG TPA: hypothetical protein VFQ13_24755 [Anaerolineales bacterium]|nr:hypothetical protein [Anaerolineales bacterium]